MALCLLHRDIWQEWKTSSNGPADVLRSLPAGGLRFGDKRPHLQRHAYRFLGLYGILYAASFPVDRLPGPFIPIANAYANGVRDRNFNRGPSTTRQPCGAIADLASAAGTSVKVGGRTRRGPV